MTMRKDSILQQYYYKKLPIKAKGGPNSPYHPITNPTGYKTSLSDAMEMAKRSDERAIAASMGPQVGQYNSVHDVQRKKAAQDYARSQAQKNSALAQTMGSFTPSGDNPDAGVIGAENFVNMNPLITGPIMSTSRLYGAGRSMLDSKTFNPYFSSDKGIMGNIFGGLQLAGDIGMLKMATGKPSTSFDPTPNPATRIEFPTSAKLANRNQRVIDAHFNKKAGIPTTADEYIALLEQQRLEKEAGDIIRNQDKSDPLDKIDISEIVNRNGLVTPGYKSSFEGGIYWDKNKNDILNFLMDETTNDGNAAGLQLINDAKSFKKNVLDINDVSQSPSWLYKDIHQLIKERNWRDAFYPEKRDPTANAISDQILGFFHNNFALTSDEVIELLNNYNPSNVFTDWTNYRINNAVDLLHRQRMASGLINANKAGEHYGVGKIPPLKAFSYGEKNPTQTLGNQAMQSLKTKEQLIENSNTWMDETIAKGDWKDVGMEMRGSMKTMGLDPTNEQDVLRFLLKWKTQQKEFNLNRYSGKPDIETLFSGLNKNKFGGSIPKFQEAGQYGLGNPRDLARQMQASSSDAPLISKMKAYAQAALLHSRIKSASHESNVGPARASTPVSEEQRRRLNQQYSYTHPNAVIDNQGDLSRRNPDRSMEGVAEPHTRAAGLDKGLAHMQGAIEAAGALEGLGALGKAGYNALAQSMESGVLSNTYKLNPWAFKANPEAYYRGIGKSGLDDALESGVLRTPKEGSTWGNQVHTTSQFRIAQQYSRNTRPWKFADGESMEIINAPLPKGFSDKSYIAEIPRTSLNNPNSPVTYGSNNFHQFINQGEIPIDNVKFLEQDWLRGYKEVPKPKFISSQPEITRGPINWYDTPGFKERNPGITDWSNYMGDVKIGKPTAAMDESLMPYIDAPPSNAYKAKPWTMQELPGLHIRSTMTGSPLEKQLSKTGDININNIKSYIAKADVGQQDKFIIDKVLNEKFSGVTKINYNDFRKAVSEELVPLERNIINNYEHNNWGVGRLGYPSAKKSSFDTAIKESERQIESYTKSIKNNPGITEKDLYILKNDKEALADAQKSLEKNRILYSELPLENNSITYYNTDKFGRGSADHFDESTLGHARTLVSKEEPDIMHFLEQQSDYWQKGGKQKQFDLNRYKEVLAKREASYLEDLETLKKIKETKKDFAGNPMDEFQINQFEDIVNKKGTELQLRKGDIANPIQKEFLGKNHQERLLQENVAYAAEQGKSKMRYPTSETAAKIQGYTQKDYDIVFKELEDLRAGKISDVTKLSRETKAVITGQGNTGLVDITGEIPITRNYKDVLSDLDKNKDFARFLENKKGVKGYDPEYKTILKKYEDTPKMIKKVLGLDVKIVTDPKGNTWYEFDIPDKFKQGKGEIKAFKQGGIIEDNRGQWAHPGKNTRISSPNITMQGVNYPVFAKANNGQQRMMYPGQDYNFPGADYVDEYPMMQKGGIKCPDNVCGPGRMDGERKPFLNLNGLFHNLFQRKPRNERVTYMGHQVDPNEYGSFLLRDGYGSYDGVVSTTTTMMPGYGENYNDGIVFRSPSGSKTTSLETSNLEDMTSGRYAQYGGLTKYQDRGEVRVPSAQNGKKQGNPVSDWWYNLDDVQGTYKMYNDLDPFLKNWYQNPETQKRLKQNLQDSLLHENTNPSQLTSQAINTLQNTPAFSRELVEKAHVSSSDLEYNNELQGWKSPSTYGGNPYFNSYNYMTGTSELGSYDPDTKQIIVNSFNRPGTISHEGVHATRPFQNAMEDVIDWKYLNKKDPKARFSEQFGTLNWDANGNNVREPFEKVKNRLAGIYSSWENEEKYLNKDGMYPRIMDIRRTLNLKPGQKVDKSILKNESISNPLDNLKHYYDEDTIIEMLNTLAKNDNKKTIPSAENGMTYYQHGLDWKPKSISKNGGLTKYQNKGEVKNNVATELDSFHVYNNAVAIQKYYDNLQNKGWYKKPDVRDLRWKTRDFFKKRMESVKNESLDTYRGILRDKDSSSLEYQYFKNAYPNKNYNDYLDAVAKSLKDTKAGTDSKYYYKDLLPSVIDPMAPSTLVDLNILPNRQIYYQSVNNGTKNTPPGGRVTLLYGYDPLSVKPADIRTHEEEIQWQKLYGKNKGNVIPTKKQQQKVKVSKDNRSEILKDVGLRPVPQPTFGQTQIIDNSRGRVEPPPQPQINYNQGTSVYAPAPYGGGASGAFIGYKTKDGQIVYVKPEDYERMGVPKYGRDYIQQQSQHKYGGPLVEYYQGKMNHGEMFATGGVTAPQTCYDSNGKVVPCKPGAHKTWIFTENPAITAPKEWFTSGQTRENDIKNNEFTKEAEDFKNYLIKNQPGEDIEIYPTYKSREDDRITTTNRGKTLNEILRKSDAKTRLAFLAHHGDNLYGNPAGNLGKKLQATTYDNCYFGSCFSGDIAASDEFKDLTNFHFRPGSGDYFSKIEGLKWLGVNPNKNSQTGEEGINNAFYNTSYNVDLINNLRSKQKDIGDKMSDLYNKNKNSTFRLYDKRHPNYKIYKDLIDQQSNVENKIADLYKPIIVNPKKGREYDVLNPTNQPHIGKGNTLWFGDYYNDNPQKYNTLDSWPNIIKDYESFANGGFLRKFQDVGEVKGVDKYNVRAATTEFGKDRKCGLSSANAKECKANAKETKKIDREIEKASIIDQKETAAQKAQEWADYTNPGIDAYGTKYGRKDKTFSDSYNKFITTNPNFGQEQSTLGLSPEQRYAMLYHMAGRSGSADFAAPQRLRSYMKLPEGSRFTDQQLYDATQKMGGIDKYADWWKGGYPEIKQENGGSIYDDGGPVPTDRKSQKFYNTLKNYYTAPERTEKEKAQYEAFNKLNQEHGYAPVAIKNRTMMGKRSMMNPFSGRLNIVPEENPEYGEIASKPQRMMDMYLTEYPHYQQYNEHPEESKLRKSGRFLGHIGNDFGQMFKNLHGLNFNKAYDKNYDTPGTTEYEAHNVMEPKLRDEFDKYVNDYNTQRYGYGKSFANGGAVSLNGIIRQNREDRDSNSYSGGISKYKIGGQANQYYYNKGYGVPHFDDGGGTNCPDGQYWDTLSNKCVPRPAPFITSNIDEYNRRQQLASDSTYAAVDSRSSIEENNKNSANQKTVTSFNQNPVLATTDKSYKDKPKVAKRVTKYKKEPPTRYTTEEYKKQLVKEGNTPQASNEFVDVSASTISGDQIINPVAITRYPVEGKQYDEKGNLIGDISDMQYVPEFQEAKQDVQYKPDKPKFTLTYTDSKGKLQTLNLGNYDDWKKINDRFAGSRAYLGSTENGNKSEANISLGMFGNLNEDPNYPGDASFGLNDITEYINSDSHNIPGTKQINDLFDSPPTKKLQPVTNSDGTVSNYKHGGTLSAGNITQRVEYQLGGNVYPVNYVPQAAMGGPTYMNKFGYLVDKLAGGAEFHHGYYDKYGGDTSVPQLPDLQGPLLQYYYSKGGKR